MSQVDFTDINFNLLKKDPTKPYRDYIILWCQLKSSHSQLNNSISKDELYQAGHCFVILCQSTSSNMYQESYVHYLTWYLRSIRLVVEEFFDIYEVENITNIPLTENILTESIEEDLPTIEVLHNYVKNKPVKTIPVSKLLHNLKPTKWEEGEERPGTPEFISRAKKSNTKYPIIIFRAADDNKLYIMDGVHRLWKRAKIQHKKNIKCVFLKRSEVRNFKWKDHNGQIVDFTNE